MRALVNSRSRILGGRANLATRCAATISASRPPAPVGESLHDVDTPALLVDLDAFDRNCEKLRRVMAGFPGVAVRPHAKAHKCAEVARRQLQLLGAQGVCCQKVIEAEAMAEGGVSDLLLSNEALELAELGFD
ncbi:hypothetical protein HYH02_000728 [Chlamydomonas schloesseri]|uniref:Alanine racemase N-terminal domain-containing protein n=1 Tax=Chlamydomonas schloesseri TaxID=2026947 RepID=A0A836BD63_9CHLO|nr:hypothetical protein HYH02_000728 [Chlamydomonas schloesseri]|eukprot:KAG2454898.1 hypothetical protein HYH02_000728 [Chlamydomonas schloesseri]